MGLLDSLRAVFGTRAERDATRRADPDDLFGMSTAYVTMEADLGFPPGGTAALCFSGVDSSGFRGAVADIERILEVGAEETGTAFEVRTDGAGYEWVVLEDPQFEDLVTSVHFAADTLVEEGFGSRLLAALFTFERDGRPFYWVYSFRRGRYYPFAPTGNHERDAAVEFKLESVLDGELEVEPDKEYWYPLWPDGRHPWE
jgi:hypothetical protein